MKRPLYILLMVSIVLTSCEAFKSNDELLTEKVWILQSRYLKKQEDYEKYYKKSEQEITMKFEKNGQVVISEKNGANQYRTIWEWVSEEEDILILTIDTGDEQQTINIFKLTSEDFDYAVYDHIIDFPSSDRYSFKTSESSNWWSDSSVKMRNESNERAFSDKDF